MKKLSKIGIGVLLGYFLANSLIENDFIELQNHLLSKIGKVEPKLKQYFYELNNLTNSIDPNLNLNITNEKILNKLKEIQDEIASVKSEETAKLILDNLGKEGD